MTEDTKSSASVTAPLGESTNRDCTDSHRFEKRPRSVESRSRILNLSTRFSRSSNLASAFLPDPCVSTARSYSGPNFCRRPAVVLLRFRRYSHTSTAMTRITTAAKTISLGSSRSRFIETSLSQVLSQDPHVRRTLLNDYDQALNNLKLVRIDRRLESVHAAPKEIVRKGFGLLPEDPQERPLSQGERFCTALLRQVSDSEGWPLGAGDARSPGFAAGADQRMNMKA